MRSPIITITTTEAIYYLTTEEFMTATENGFLDHLGAEKIVSVDEELEVDSDWKRDGF